MIEFLSRLVGTMQSRFNIGGPGGLRLKNNSGALDVRNGGDTAWANVTVKQVQINGANSTNGVQLQAPAGLSVTPVFVLPGTTGSTGQSLVTDGNGNLRWANSEGGGANTFEFIFDQTTDGDIFLPSNDDRLREIILVVESAAAGGSPTAEVGTAAAPSAYAAAGDFDLLTAGIYRVTLEEYVDVDPVAVRLTITASGQSFSGRVFVVRDPWVS